MSMTTRQVVSTLSDDAKWTVQVREIALPDPGLGEVIVEPEA
jgi:hypothetical protein